VTSDAPEPTSAAESASGMLMRLARGSFGSIASTDTAAAGQPPPLDRRLGPWVAEILSINVHMIKLASAGSSSVRVESGGTTVKVTALL
jgi:hypothetical protein